MHLYWSVGRDILDRQRAAGWGSKVIDRLLPADLRREFPDRRGWSPSNVKSMRRIAQAWLETLFSSQGFSVSRLTLT
nr:DUF1016 N-terminal domain-containing protein [Cellulosimicrobium arenosum]